MAEESRWEKNLEDVRHAIERITDLENKTAEQIDKYILSLAGGALVFQ